MNRNCEQSLLEDSDYIEEIFVPENMEENIAENSSQQQQQLQINTLDLAFNPSSSTSDTQQSVPVFIQPGPISRVISTFSSSGSCSSTKCRPKKEARLNDEYASAIHSLAESMSQPIKINTVDNTTITPTSLDPVDNFVVFLGSLLKSFQDKESMLKVMNNITQLVMEEKLKELNRAKQNNKE